ncbi:DUF5949 family protein [Streptomyces sp. SP18CS02]|uniref:DUF5949 family protein n=1 Tax=Streptomyces sp. SP18CS02 TaxID=3002531 RepID=UPI002E773049|nr:DUF5949 family protein [Streptomyces sp. SP18CS02]MEE1751120.1 DUF5949 family protein [Streptomyces sp. SP18CS02]
MTSSTVAFPGRQRSLLGTLSVLPWASEPSADSAGTPMLMVYSTGDGPEGPEAGREALAAELEKLGLPIGERVVDLASETRIPITLLVEAEQLVLTTPFMRAQCSVPPQWEQAAHEKGQVYLICALRPWPQGAPGREVGEEELRAFAGDEETLSESAHCVVPVRRVRG